MSELFLIEKRKKEIIKIQLQYLETKFQIDEQELETVRRATSQALE